jgi:hypothetical protein
MFFARDCTTQCTSSSYSFRGSESAQVLAHAVVDGCIPWLCRVLQVRSSREARPHQLAHRSRIEL